MAINPMTERPATIDADREAKSVEQRKAEAAELRPVRDYDRAATSTGDFVHNGVTGQIDRDDEDEDEETAVVLTPAEKKNLETERKKKAEAAKAAKAPTPAVKPAAVKPAAVKPVTVTPTTGE
jgi:hypothetical protein